MISLKNFIATSLSIAAIAACGNETRSNESHDDGKIVRSSLSANWMTMDRASFLIRVLNSTEREALPANSFTTVHLQSWIDKIDEYARKRDPDLLASIPKPNVIVLRTDEANAFVASTAVCYNIKVTYGNGQRSAPNGVYIDKSQDLLDVDIPPNYPCINAEPTELPKIAEEISKRGQKCSFKVTPSGIEFPSSCGTLDPSFKGGFTAPKLLLLKTPNWFVVLAGIVDLLKSEESLVGVLAHELGHYYRSHSNVYKNEYDFFYTQKEAGNPSHRPVRDESLEEFGKMIFQASSVYYPISLIPEPDALSFDPILYLALGDIARQAGVLSSCKKASMYESPMTARDLGGLPFRMPVNPETYNTFISLVTSCLEQIESSEGIRSNINLSAALKSPTWAPFRNNSAFSKEQRDRFIGMVSSVFKVLGDVSIPKLITKDEILSLQIKMREKAGQIRDSLQKAYDAKLGQYTAEQEADDLSVEILSKIGLGGESAVDTYMALVSPNDGFGGFEIGLKRCEQMRANKWIDPEGKFDLQLLPVGNYSEDHHSGCYRAFNASREIKAHNYASHARISVDPSVWGRIKQELASKRIAPVGLKKTKVVSRQLVYPKGCSLAPKI